MAGDVRRPWAPALLLVASGFAGLGYQVVWTQECALWLGHESAAVLAVVTAFFGGLSAGALLLGPRIEKSLRPVRWYAVCELTIALWGLLLALAMPPFSGWLLRITGAEPTPTWQWSVAFAGTFLLLLPATAAMGATLPAMQRVVTSLRGRGQSVAVLYAANTFGAVLGVLGVAFWLIPALGLMRSAFICTALNLGCGLTCLALFRGQGETAKSTPDVAVPSVRARGLLLKLAATGLLGIGYEVLVVRVISQVTEDTVYTFALLLAIYLVGSAAGAAGYERWLAGRRSPDKLSDALFGALSTACLLGSASLWAAERSKALALSAFGGSVSAAILAEAVPALLAFGLPTLVMGAVFSHLARLAQASGTSFGRALGVNTLGAALAPGLFGVLVAPAVGPKLALLLVDVGYLALIGSRSRFRKSSWLPASAAVLLLLLTPPLAFIDVPDGGHIVSYRDGVVAAVSVVEDVAGVARLRINNRAQEGSSVTQRVDGRQAWLPLLLHAAPRRALFLGLGTGVTAASAAEDPTLHVDAIELLSEVIEASAYFAKSVADGAAYVRLRIRAADARRYVRASPERYDVIVSDNFHPARSGSGSLYTVEHFRAVQQRLSAGGVFCQWLPLHQLDRETLRSIAASFLAVYPQGWAMLASNSLETPVLGLVGRGDASRFDAAALQQRLSRAALPERVAGIGLEDELAVLGSFVAGPTSLRRFANNATINTDDRPVVAYLAPRITYAPDSSPSQRFIALLHELFIAPNELITAPPDPSWPSRLAAYWAARNRFIESGRNVRPSPSAEEMLALVRQPLLSVLRQSPDFRPAYDPLLSMATALARSNVSEARTLLTELTQIQPARTEATQALTLMGADASSVQAGR
jgi:spermidine synthase